MPDLADDHGIRTGHRHQLAGLNDMGGLAVIRAAARRDTQARHHDAGHQRDDHDFQVGTAIQ